MIIATDERTEAEAKFEAARAAYYSAMRTYAADLARFGERQLKLEELGHRVATMRVNSLMEGPDGDSAARLPFLPLPLGEDMGLLADTLRQCLKSDLSGLRNEGDQG